MFVVVVLLTFQLILIIKLCLLFICWQQSLAFIGSALAVVVIAVIISATVMLVVISLRPSASLSITARFSYPEGTTTRLLSCLILD